MYITKNLLLIRKGASIALLLLLCAGFKADAGTAAEIEMLLQSQVVTYAQATRFVLEAAGAAAFADPAQAFAFAMERNWLPRRASSEAPVTLSGISLLLMQAFDLRGGILFTITKSPHFAYREMEYMGFIHGRVSPNQQVSGDTLLYITGKVLAHIEKEEVAASRRARTALNRSGEMGELK